MNTGKKYHTRQKEQILRCLMEHEEAYLTIQQLERYLADKDQKVGLTTIYRNLEKLEAEQRLTKVTMDAGQGSCYKYLPFKEASPFYLKCEGCGSVVNIECPELKHLYSHVVEEHHVEINPVKTMFYGRCESCSDK